MARTCQLERCGADLDALGKRPQAIYCCGAHRAEASRNALRGVAQVPLRLSAAAERWRPADASDELWMHSVRRGTCVIYVLHHAPNGLAKIGTTTDLLIRMQAIQAASPVPLTLRAVCLGAGLDERLLHTRFAAHRQHGEWYDATVLSGCGSCESLAVLLDTLRSEKSAECASREPMAAL